MSQNMNNQKTITMVLAGVVAVSLSASLSADIVYDNSTTALGSQVSQAAGVTEFGDQVQLAGSANNHLALTDFSFQYVTAGATVTGAAVLRIYDIDGTSIPGHNSPGTLLFDSTTIGTIPLQSGQNTVNINGITGVNTSSSFIWTVSFSGLSAGETAGLPLYDPPTVGSSFKDFYEKSGGTWSLNLIDNGNTPANFAAQVGGVVIVPEPSTIALGLIGLGSCLGYGFLRRRA